MTSASSAASPPVSAVATMGVPVTPLTVARRAGSRRSRPRTTNRRDWPSRPVMVEVTMPSSAPSDTILAAHPMPCARKAAEKGAWMSIWL